MVVMSDNERPIDKPLVSTAGNSVTSVRCILSFLVAPFVIIRRTRFLNNGSDTWFNDIRSFFDGASKLFNHSWCKFLVVFAPVSFVDFASLGRNYTF